LIVGVMSDTHGNHLAARKAVEIFKRVGVGHIIHCGDVGGEGVFDELIGHPLTFVWGNTDEPNQALAAYVRALGVALPNGVPAQVELGGKRFAVFHGHEKQFRSCKLLKVDYVLYGHTHEADVEVLDGKCFVNPGALFRANPKTVATIDTQSSEIKFHAVAVD
jgi:uncharacterized protein